MDLTRLATLKDRLLNAKQYSDVWGYFLDHFGEDPSFIALGQRVPRSPLLQAVIAQVAGQILKTDVLAVDSLLTRLDEQNFIHGTCTVNGRLVGVIYFDDVHSGLLAVIPSVASGETHFVRFSGRPVPRVGRGSPSEN